MTRVTIRQVWGGRPGRKLAEYEAPIDVTSAADMAHALSSWAESSRGYRATDLSGEFWDRKHGRHVEDFRLMG